MVGDLSGGARKCADVPGTDGAAMITKRQRDKALKEWRIREQAKRAERLVVPGYPADHNPYLPHNILPSCYPDCRRDRGRAAMNLSQTEFDTLAERIGYSSAFESYPYSLTYRPRGGQVWTLYFSNQEERQTFANGVRALGGTVLGTSHGDVRGWA